MSSFDEKETDSAVNQDRRDFIKSIGASGLALVGAAALSPACASLAKGEVPGTSMSPNEDLMQEHALLNRVLLVYEECGRRLEAKKELDPGILKSSAQTIQNFVENYHEKLEEDLCLPPFCKGGKADGTRFRASRSTQGRPCSDPGDYHIGELQDTQGYGRAGKAPRPNPFFYPDVSASRIARGFRSLPRIPRSHRQPRSSASWGICSRRRSTRCSEPRDSRGRSKRLPRLKSISASMTFPSTRRNSF